MKNHLIIANKKILFKEFLLVLTTFIWGFAFVFQDMAMQFISPYTFNMLRSFIGATFVLLFFAIIKMIQKKKKKVADVTHYKKKDLWIGGTLCGVCLFAAMSTQQVGILYEGAGKSGFITALYILFVPIFGLFFKRKTNLKIVFCLIVAACGVYFINKSEDGFVWTKGSFVLLLCAIFYALQILAVDHYANLCDTFLLTALQFFVCGILSFILMICFEHVHFNDILKATLPILFVGVLSSGVGFTFQTYAQKEVHPVVASLIMSLESLFAVIGAYFILHETLSLYESIGCVLIFIAVITSQISFKRKKLTQ